VEAERRKGIQYKHGIVKQINLNSSPKGLSSRRTIKSISKELINHIKSYEGVLTTPNQMNQSELYHKTERKINVDLSIDRERKIK
jgi:hypothetical protein